MPFYYMAQMRLVIEPLILHLWPKYRLDNEQLALWFRYLKDVEEKRLVAEIESYAKQYRHKKPNPAMIGKLIREADERRRVYAREQAAERQRREKRRLIEASYEYDERLAILLESKEPDGSPTYHPAHAQNKARKEIAARMAAGEQIGPA